MSTGFGEINAARQTPEARAELEAAQADARAQADEALRSELARYADHLLPGAAEAIAAQHRRSLGATPDPVRTAVAVSEFMRGPLSARFKRPAPEADILRTVLARYQAEFKSPAAAEAFHRKHALDLVHRPEADVVAHVVRLLRDRSSNPFLKTPIGPSAQVQRVAKLMAPWAHQIKTDEHELAAMWPDLVDPLRPAMRDVDLERTILIRLSLPAYARHLRVDRFDPEDRRGGHPRPGVGAPAEHAPAARPLFRL